MIFCTNNKAGDFNSLIHQILQACIWRPICIVISALKFKFKEKKILWKIQLPPIQVIWWTDRKTNYWIHIFTGETAASYFFHGICNFLVRLTSDSQKVICEVNALKFSSELWRVGLLKAHCIGNTWTQSFETTLVLFEGTIYDKWNEGQSIIWREEIWLFSS